MTYTPPHRLSVDFNFDSEAGYFPPAGRKVPFEFITTRVTGRAKAGSVAEGSIDVVLLLNGAIESNNAASGNLTLPLSGRASSDSQAIGDITLPSDMLGFAQTESVVNGTLSDGTPGVDAPGLQFPGWLGQLSSNDLYNHIWIRPAVLDASLLINEYITFRIFSSYLTPRILSVTATAAQGLELRTATGGPVDQDLGVFECREYRISRRDLSIQNYDIHYLFQFPDQLRDVFVVGDCPNLMTPFPDYNQPMRLVKKWDSEVLYNFDGGYQTRRLRLHPTQTLHYKHTSCAARRQLLANQLAFSNSWSWAVPKWDIRYKLAAPVTEWDLDITLDTADHEIQMGDLLLLLSTDGTGYVLKARAPKGATIPLDSYVLHEWPAGTDVYLLGRAFVEAKSIKAQTYMISEFDLSVKYIDLIKRRGKDPYPVYRGLTVYEEPLNWAGDVNTATQLKSLVLDGEIGGTFIDTQGRSPITRQTFRVFLNSRAKIRKFNDWLIARQGRGHPFWLPSGSLDLTLSADIGHDSFIVVRRQEYARLIAEGVGRRDIRIELWDGRVLYYRIDTSYALDSHNERLNLDTVHFYGGANRQTTVVGKVGGNGWVPEAVPASKVKLISFMMVACLADNEVEVTHYSPEFATSEFQVQGVMYDV